MDHNAGYEATYTKRTHLCVGFFSVDFSRNELNLILEYRLPIFFEKT